MKKILNILFLMVLTVSLFSQTTLTFVGRDRTGNDYVQLSRVSVFDLDQLWHQEIFYPDTTLVLYVNGTVGVGTWCTAALQMQNNPNPFDGTTDVVLSTPYEGDVTMEITDVNGHIVGTHSVRPQPGTHQFRLTLSTPGTYVLTARQNGRTVSVKMVNAGNGGGDGIEYVGSVETMCTSSLQLKSNTRGDGNYPFHNGDLMRYTGYAVVDDVEIESETIQNTQNGSQTIPLKFDVARPTVVTNAASNIAASAATLNGEVTDDNNASVTERGFCYGTAPYPTYSSSTRVEAGDGLGSFDATINGLTAATTYYTRAYAKNVVGLSYGANLSFRTLDTLPVVTTTEPSNITATTFTSGGDVLVLNSNSLTARGICWNTTGAPTIADSHTTQSGGLGSFTSNITDLDCGTIYYVRAYATNSVGTAYGEEYSVTTTQELARVVTGNVSNITDNSAVCGGEVPYDGCSEVTARGVCWSTEQNPTIADDHTTDGSGLGDFTSQLSGLNYATTYYVRAYATNDVGTAYGLELSFTTQPILPTVTTAEATDITATAFTCGGNVTNDGGSEVTARGICWSTEPNPTISDNYTTDGSGLGTFTSNVTGLACGTTYYVRAYATNSVGTAYGEEYSVTTMPPTIPDVVLSSAIIYNGLSIAIQAEVINENCLAITERGVCWSTATVPTVNDYHTNNGSGIGIFSDTLTGLETATTYYIRAYATNESGTAYSEQESIITPDYPIVTTTSVTDITSSTAISGGNVTSDGGATVTACGVCWSTSQNPTITDNRTTDGMGLGGFHSILTELSSGTTYYVRAYATNSVGTAYGEEYSFTTLALPTVITTSVTAITSSTATSGGSITSDGGATVSARGVCWSTSQTPTIADDHTTDGNGTGSFTSSLTGLTANTTYYVRAYATNSVGTAYGGEVTFTTSVPDGYPCPNETTLTDIDGNNYNTVKIGTQCWMKENLRTTKYADGTSISQGSSYSTTVAYWYYPNNDATNKPTYGLLYNWKAVMRNSSSSDANPSGVQGICPTGWHVPSDAEWTQLTGYVNSQSQYRCNAASTTIGKALAGATGWQSSSTNTCNVGNSPVQNNATGFSALPAGYDNDGFGNVASFWSATEIGGSAYYRILYYNNTGVYRFSVGKTTGYSVRCVRDDKPFVSTQAITNITKFSAECGGEVIAENAATVTARGVCWSNAPLLTIDDNHTIDGNGIGSFSSILVDLDSNTTYYVRAYATNSVGTSYGEEVCFVTLGDACQGVTILTDIDGNTYNTVQIGTQCWMKENLRTTKYADGTSISQGSGTSTTTGYWYYPGDSSSNKTTYGLLYNWKAVMRNSYASSANPSGVQGICPTGWHVPSDAEFTQLTDYVSSQSQYVCGSNNTYIAKALAGTTGWSSSTGTCCVGNTPSQNNSTGFSALPAGYYNGSCNGFGGYAYFWSATVPASSSHAWRRSLYYYNDNVGRNDDVKTAGYSVRCVKD